MAEYYEDLARSYGPHSVSQHRGPSYRGPGVTVMPATLVPEPSPSLPLREQARMLGKELDQEELFLSRAPNLMIEARRRLAKAKYAAEVAERDVRYLSDMTNQYTAARAKYAPRLQAVVAALNEQQGRA